MNNLALQDLARAIGQDDVPGIRKAIADGGSPSASLEVIVGGFDTALAKAVSLSHYNSVKALVEAGADVNARPGIANTPMIMRAARSANVAMIDLLHRVGADPNACDRYGHTALTSVGSALMSVTGVFEATKKLLDIGADPRIHALSMETPLHSAVERRCLPAMHLLLDRGCPLDVKDSAGDSPLDRAIGIDNSSWGAATERDSFMLTFLAAGMDPNRIPTVKLRGIGRVQAAAAVGWTSQCIRLLEEGHALQRSHHHRSATDWAMINGHAETAAAIQAWSARNMMRSIASKRIEFSPA